MESVPRERIPHPQPFLRILRLKDRRQDAGGKTNPVDWFSMSALCARSFSRPAGRDYFFVLVDSGR